MWAPSRPLSRFPPSSEGKSGRQAARFRVFRPHRKGRVGANRPATFGSHPEGGRAWAPTSRPMPFRPPSGTLLVNRAAVFPVRPTDCGTDRRAKSLLVNRPAVFPVRPTDCGTDRRATSLLVNRPAVFPVRPTVRGIDPRAKSFLVNRPAVFPVRPTVRGTDRRATSLLVNRRAVFPIRSAGGRGSRAGRSIPPGPFCPCRWAAVPDARRAISPAPRAGAPVGRGRGSPGPNRAHGGTVPVAADHPPNSLPTQRHPRRRYACPPFFVHFVHFAVPVRPRAILPEVLAQFRGTFFKQSRADRG